MFELEYARKTRTLKDQRVRHPGPNQVTVRGIGAMVSSVRRCWCHKRKTRRERSATSPPRMPFGKIIRRLFLYAGLALASLAIFALIFALSVHTHITIPFRWIALGNVYRCSAGRYGQGLPSILASTHVLGRMFQRVGHSSGCIHSHPARLP